MAVKSKIQEALEKAKVQGKAPRSNVGTTNPQVLPHMEATANGTTAAQRHSAVQPNFDTPQLAIDRNECIANRILFNDGERPSNASAVASYRMLRTRILQRARANNWKMIGVTSPGAGDGKSITALNLAVTIAREKNNNVFLLDLDMRNPSMCNYLGVVPPIQITEFFGGTASAKDVFFSIGVENLTLAGAVTGIDHSSELLAAGQVEELFAYICRVSSEPLVLVDLPPVLATDDALVMAPKVDASLLVLAEGKSRRDSSAKALEILADFDIAGIVLNRSKTELVNYYST
jgi:Mrp family chromosome partitioning ATPase